MNKRIIYSTFLAVTLLFSSCATIFTGSKRKVLFETEPAGATLFVNGIERCTTPCDYRVTAEDSVKFELEGYKERVIIVDTKFNLVSILNGISIIGWGVDAISGAIKRVDTKYLKINLKQDDAVTLNNALENGRIDKVDINTANKIIETVIVLNE